MAFSEFGLALHVAAFDEHAEPVSSAHAAASTEGQTASHPFCQAKLEELPGSSSPRLLDGFIAITAQTVAGGTPKLGCSVLSSVLATDQAEAAFAEFREASAYAVAASFSPFINVMQAQAILAGNVAPLGLHGGSNVATGVGSRVTKFLVGALEASLDAVTFRFA